MTIPIKRDENILVVAREKLFQGGEFQGFMSVVSFDAYQAAILEHCQFLPRSIMETDPRYKQIIPYLIFSHEDKFFLMQRTSVASEQRLKDKFLLGVGGHLRQEDMVKPDIATWAHRELHEEIAYDGAYTMKPLGIINDERDMVGQVHIGFVFLVHAQEATFSVKSELKQGRLVTREEIVPFYDRLESWSQMVFDYLNLEFAPSPSRHSAQGLIPQDER